MVGPGFNAVEVDNIWQGYKLDNSITCFTCIWQSLSRHSFSFFNFLFVAVQVLLFHDQSYEIHYEYTVSLNTTQDRSSEKQREPEYLYIWTHSSWQDCTVQCGGGKTHHTHSHTHWDVAGCENGSCKSNIWIRREKNNMMGLLGYGWCQLYLTWPDTRHCWQATSVVSDREIWFETVNAIKLNDIRNEVSPYFIHQREGNWALSSLSKNKVPR